MPAEYKYVFSTLRDESVVAEIDLFGVYMDMEINQGGMFTGSFKLDATGKRNDDVLAATEPGRTFVAVERNGIVVWSGFVWSRTYQSQAKNIQLNCQSFDKYPSKRLIREDLTYTDVEQRTIFCELWVHMQEVEGGNLNINVPVDIGFEEVTPKSVSVKASDFKLYSEVLDSIADTDDGFDWYISTTKVGSQYVRNLHLGFPTLGAPFNAQSLVFEYPGAILNYYQTESMAEAGTNVFVIGSGEGENMPYAEYYAEDLVLTGTPRWDVVPPHKDVSSQLAIEGLAAREGPVRRPPMSMVNFSMKGDLDPEFGSWSLGDYCTIVIKDSRNPQVLTVENRIVKWELTPPSSSSTEEVTIRFPGDNNV